MPGKLRTSKSPSMVSAAPTLTYTTRSAASANQRLVDGLIEQVPGRGDQARVRARGLDQRPVRRAEDEDPDGLRQQRGVLAVLPPGRVRVRVAEHAFGVARLDEVVAV